MKETKFIILTLLIVFSAFACDNKPEKKAETMDEGEKKELIQKKVAELEEVKNKAIAENTEPEHLELKSSHFKTKMEQSKDYILVDVRTPEEYGLSRIPKSKNINIKSPEFADEIAKLDKNVPVFAYCKAGVRSKRAMKKMKKAGIKRVYSLQGGIDDWQEAGFEVVLAR